VIHEELGLALTALGKTDEAASHFQKMTEASDWWFKATAHMRIGDLYSPLVGSKSASKEKALAAYKEALSALPEGGDAEKLPTAPRFLRDELEKRIALLQ
jgi:tetratricopeptide (TPR) repeat protein